MSSVWLTVCLVYRLVFSQSLLSLDLIEAFLAHWDKQVSTPEEQVCVAYFDYKVTTCFLHFKVYFNFMKMRQYNSNNVTYFTSLNFAQPLVVMQNFDNNVCLPDWRNTGMGQRY